MLLLDDILLLPVHGVLWVFREIGAAAQQELDAETDNIKARLSELYRMLEAGQISEAEFDAEEKQLLERLEARETRESRLEADVEEAESDSSEDLSDPSDAEPSPNEAEQ